MVGLPIAEITVYGSNFTDTSQVLVDGIPTSQTVLIAPGTLQAQITVNTPEFFATAGVHQVSVQTGNQVSNAVQLTVYYPQPGPQVMRAIPSFVVSEIVSSATSIIATTADINGDGLADLITTGPTLANSGSISIVYGQKDGTFGPAQIVPSVPGDFVVGDVDGNGTADLITFTADANSSPLTTTVNVSLGDGHGNFAQPSAWQTFAGTLSSQAFLADIDGDGKADLLLVYNPPSGTAWYVAWLKNTGSGFAAPVTISPLALDNGPIVIADFNQDGKPDILYTTNTSPESLHILFNQGNGQFKDQAVMGLNGLFGVPTLMDFNLDGIPDLLLQVPVVFQGVSNTVLYSFSGAGNGSFTQVGDTAVGPTGFQPYQFVAGDFDHDGFPDLAGMGGYGEPGEIVYLFGDGHGNFVSQPVVGPNGTLAVGDFNGDGIPDVAVASGTNFVTLALGRSDRNFPSAVPLSPAIVGTLSAGDVNGDGFPDVFVAGSFFVPGIPGTVFANNENNGFQAGVSTDPASVMLADLTGKGVADLLGWNDSGSIVWPNNGSLDFSSSPIAIGPGNPPFIVADMDGDGHPDVVTPFQIFYGNGSYQFTPVALPAALSAPFVVGNFTGNGRLDIAAGGLTYLNMGNRTFQTVQSGLPLSEGTLAVVGDFNGDGKDDLAVVAPSDSSIAIYYSLGDGTFYQGAQLNPVGGPGGLAVGDFDGDGKIDLAAALNNQEVVAVFFNAGKGQFTRSFFASGAGAIGMIQADLNRDGKPDLVITNFQTDFAPPNVNVLFHQ